jgi:hypothetical protein
MPMAHSRTKAQKRVAWRRVAFAQGAHFVGTGVWPILHLSSFLAVTGPKTDLWLVQMFGALVCAPGVALLHAAWTGQPSAQGVLLAWTSAVVLLAGDVFFVTRGDISRIYLADAAIELAFIGGWVLAALERPSATPPTTSA